MKSTYKGFTITVERDLPNSGIEMFASIIRESDGFVLVDETSTAKRKMSEYLKELKGTVDEYLEEGIGDGI